MKIPYVFKKCSKCGRWLVGSKVNFYKSKKGKYGLNCWCKECIKKYSKKHYQENRESIKQYSNEYYKENKEKITRQQKKYREENKEYYNQYNKNYYQENKEYCVKHSKKYREEHKQYNKNYYQENKEYYEKYYEANKEHIKDYYKKYYQTAQGQMVRFNAYNRRKQRKETLGDGITPDQWLDMMIFFDWKCAYSGESVSENNGNRTIDHIVPLAKGGEHEIWNCVPMTRKFNSSKNDKDMDKWYPQQDFYDEDKLNKINAWQEYAYDKWGKQK